MEQINDNDITPNVVIINPGAGKMPGGITLTIENLFKKWPREAKSLMAYGRGSDRRAEYSDVYLFPEDTIVKRGRHKGLLKSLASYRILLSSYVAFRNRRMMMQEVANRQNIANMTEWITDQKANFVYAVFGSRLSLIPIYLHLMDSTKLPFVIHVVDDWISNSYFGVFDPIFAKILNRKFEEILRKATAVFVISDAMATEYKSRYGIESYVFHNPVPSEKWDQVQYDDTARERVYRIVYFGTVEGYHEEGIESLNIAIGSLHRRGIKAICEIYGNVRDPGALNRFRKYRYVESKGYIEYEKLPSLISGSDILFLPLSFHSRRRKSLRLSIPTKLTEYMLCPQPMIIFAPAQLALTRYAKDKEIAYLVTRNSANELADALISLIQNKSLRTKISKRAYEVAMTEHTTEVVCKRFRRIIEECVTSHHARHE